MELLIALKAGGLTLGRWSYSASHQSQPLACSTPSQTRRLVLNGAPDPYFVVNPHLFEDRNLWPEDGLRELGSDLGLTTSGTRFELIFRLQDFNRNLNTSYTADSEYEECEEHQESRYLNLVPIARDNILQRFKVAHVNPQSARPALTRGTGSPELS